MRISGSPLAKLERLYADRVERTTRNQATQRTSQVTADYEVQVSPEARMASEVRAAIAGLPDVRADVVGGLKSAIDSGSYHVSDEALAEKLVAHVLQYA